jgi:hypothetical protein
MSMLQLNALDAEIARARQLVAEQQRRVPDRHRLGDGANSRELLHDLAYWLRSLEACRENLLRQNRLDGAKSAGQRCAQRPERANAG